MVATIDEALDILRHTGPDLVNGNSNHSPAARTPLSSPRHARENTR
jgi:hypothetical protein